MCAVTHSLSVSGSYESGAAELKLRRPYVVARGALPFASAAQQQAPAPRGPILSELASVNGRGGGVLLEQGAPKLQKQKTPPRRGGAPGGKLNTAAFALAPADISVIPLRSRNNHIYTNNNPLVTKNHVLEFGNS